MSEDKEYKIEPELKQRALLYHKIGGFYKISYKEFDEMPRWLIRELCNILDDASDDLSKFLSYDEYCEYRNLLRLHGGGKEEAAEPNTSLF